MRAIVKVLANEAFAPIERVPAPLADESSVLLAHSAHHLERVRQAIPDDGIAEIDADTFVGLGSFEAALCAVGASVAAVDDVYGARAGNVFVACRPPGHHATKTQAMGFCLFNNAAIAARHAQAVHGAERVVIVDWDVHHGNGTQDIFWDDPSVLYCSTHQMPLFPGTGAPSETGAAGSIVNVPLASGAGRDDFRDAMESLIFPRIEHFRPDLIIISAGFDAHYRDPLGGLRLTEQDFSWATGKLMETAGRWSANRVVSLLEGGYDLNGLELSVFAHLSRLMKG